MLTQPLPLWYNFDCHTVSHGALFVLSADVSIAYRYWVEHPVLLDYRPADCVTTSASNTGCFVMSAKDGQPCRKCGKSEWQSRGDCSYCSKERAKRYREQNKEKVSESNKARAKRWRQNNPGRNKERRKQGILRAPGSVCQKCGHSEWQRSGECSFCSKERAKKRRQLTPPTEKDRERSRQWKRSNIETERERLREWRNQHKGWWHNRRTAVTQAGGMFTTSEWNSLVDYYDYKCLCCGRSDVKLTADHVIPVSKGGTSNIDNIQPLCGPCNSSKGVKETDYRYKKGTGHWQQLTLSIEATE